MMDSNGRLAVFMAAVTAMTMIAPADVANTVSTVLDWAEQTAAAIQSHSPSVETAFEPLLRRIVGMFAG